MTIKFGTDGWRGVIADDYTFANVRIVADALARYAIEQDYQNPRVAIGYDSRFLSREFAAECARVLAAHNIHVYLASQCCPSPATSWAAHDLRTTTGIMITASHNPAQYNGFKVKADYGGSATPDIVADIEKQLPTASVEAPQMVLPSLEQAVTDGLVEYYDARFNHQQHIKSMVDWELLRAFGQQHPVVFDMMHGSGSGYIRELWPQACEIRSEANPSFDGVNPEPIEKNLLALVDAVRTNKAIVGLATDGDADRIGAVDADGTFINAQQLFALLLKHLVENRHWNGSVVKTVTVSAMVERLAKSYGLPVETTPVGFKYIADRMLESDVMIGGEESGGIGFKNYIPERDGVLCGLLLAELIATTGKTLGQLWDNLTQQFGPCVFHRIDAHIADEAKQQLFVKLRAISAKFVGKRIHAVDDRDGFKIIFDDAWLMFRASGTEPIVRIYCEGTTEQEVEKLLLAAQQFI